MIYTLQWRHNGRYSVWDHQPHDCLLNRLFKRRSKKTSKLRVTGFCAGNSPVTGEFPAQMASNKEKCSIWWRHHDPWREYKKRQYLHHQIRQWEGRFIYPHIFKVNKPHNTSFDNIIYSDLSFMLHESEGLSSGKRVNFIFASQICR